MTVPFDPRLIPDGMSEDDVNTYFYDETSRRWKKLQRTSVDVGRRVVRSGSNHFTIMINAVLAVPTNPTPLSFDPTALSSVAAASPAAGVDVIEPPTANSTGDARMALPIRLPAGRGAYTPSLAISYSSGRDNGWLGAGWDVAVSRIEIDTRWGVPRYSAGEEPRYLLDGAELVPTLEAEGPTCPGGRRYHTRVEGAYAHILRCGTAPSMYYWVVRDRDGTRFTYGDTVNARLASYRSPHGISRWHLREVTDVNNNATTFSYQHDEVSGTEPAREVYPQSITYTSHPTKSAAYSVEFVLDNGGRVDRHINARSGFKVMTRKLLRAVRVKFQSTTVRDYVLTYARGQFGKTLLASTRVYGLGGCNASTDAFAVPACSGEFHEHTFNYRVDPEGFGPVTPVCAENTPQGCPTATTVANTLTKSKTITWSGGRSASVELKGATLGASISGSFGDRVENVGMYDIDGDGDVDQVYRNEATNKLHALLNTGDRFDVPTTWSIKDLKELALDGNLSWSVDATIGGKKGGYGLSGTAGFANSTARGEKFFTDLDGDGYIDFLDAKGKSKRSNPCTDGVCFEDVTYNATTLIDPTKDPELNDAATEISQRAIPGAPVLQWVAPYSGTIKIDAVIGLVRPGTVDGISVGLFHDDAMLAGWSIINPNTPLTIANTIDVRAGDGIYLYVSTGAHDGSAGLVDEAALFPLTPLTISYVNACTDATCAQNVTNFFEGNEPTGAAVFSFTAPQLRVVAAEPLRAAYSGVLTIHGDVVKQRSSATVRYCLQKFRADAMSTDYACGDASMPGQNMSGTYTLLQDNVSQVEQTWNVDVKAGEQVVFRAEADFSYDPNVISFVEHNGKPRVMYTQACIPDEQGGCAITQGEEAEELPVPHKTFGFFAAPVSRPEPAGAPPLVYRSRGRCAAVVKPFDNPLGSQPVAVFFRTDRQGTITQPAPFVCTSTCTPPTAPVFLQDRESLSIEVVAANVPTPRFTIVELVCNGATHVKAPLIFRKTKAERIEAPTPFVGGYRGWNATFWNEREAFAPETLAAEYADLNALPGCGAATLTPADAELCASEINRVRSTAIKPDAAFDGSVLTNGLRAWVAPQSAAFIVPSVGHLNAGGIGGAGASPPGNTGPAESGGGLFDPGYGRLSTSRSYFAGVNVQAQGAELPVLPGLAIPGFHATVTRSTTKTTTDVIDLNGDGIPDVIAGNDAYQGSIGNAPTPPLSFQFKRIRDRIGTEYMIGADIGAAVSVTTPSGRRRFVLSQKAGNVSDWSFGTTRGLAVGRSQTTDDIMDVNGDGLPDVVQRRGSNINVRYNLGYELGAWETIATIDPEIANTPIDTFESLEKATTVISDVLDTTSDALTHETTLTQNDTWSIGIFIAKGARTTRKTSARVTRQLADLNGDGLPDILLKRSGHPIKVQYNRGADFAPAQDWTTPGWGALQLSPSFHSTFAPVVSSGLHAVTGDDVLAATGTEYSRTYSGSIQIPIPTSPPFFVGGYHSRSRDEDTFELALMDINGDGHPDHVLRRAQSTGAPRVYVKPNLVTLTSNLLERVNRPLGGSIKLQYATKPNTPDMPQRRAVLSRVEVDDGVDLGASFASPNLVTRFEYEGGYFHRLEKQFMGFARVSTFRADNGSVEQYYDNRNFTLQGLVWKEIRRDSAWNVVAEHRTTYEVQVVQGPAGPLAADPACVAAMHTLLQRLPNNEACTPKIAVVLRIDDTRGELGTFATKTHTVRDTSRDRFGNVETSIDEGDAAVANDTLYLKASYQNDTTNWILGRPTLVQARVGSLFGSLLRSRTANYDARGRLREVTVNTGGALATTTIDYDTFGNLARVETPPNASGQTQTYDVTFDPTAATYPVSTTDGFGYTSTATYDLGFGVATIETDTNGAQLVRTVDGFGRLMSVRSPYDTGAPGITFEYHPNESPPRAMSVTRTSAPADYSGPLPPPLTTVTIADGFGRAIQVQKTSLVDGVPGMTTAGLVERDYLGRVTRTWHPFFTPGASTGFLPPVATYATTTTYDELDRATSTTQPDGGVQTASYAIATAPNGQVLFHTQHTVVVPGLNRVREEYADQLGRMRVYVEHPAAGVSSVTKYDYLPTGELGSITDAEGNITGLGYDWRGLRTTLSNPDTGLIQDDFDLMGNRIATIEPNHRAVNTKVAYKYDRNRLTSVDYPSKPDVTYQYGAPGAANGTAGRVARIIDESGSTDFSYGALGETRRTLRTFAPAGTAQPLKFDHRFTYDSLGRQLELRYPDGECVTNVYNAAGALVEVRGAGDGWQRTYASAMRYDVFGNRTRMEVGRVITSWNYDPMRVRLSNVVSTLQPPGGTASQIQNLAYTYDAADNPTLITNELAAAPMSATKAPRRSSLTLTYDGVDRLTYATGDAQQDWSRTTTYAQTFSYSPSHNLLEKSRQHGITRRFNTIYPPATNIALSYQYSTRPHLPDQVGTLQLQYDPSGNAKVRADSATGLMQNLTWDDDGRLVQLTDTGGVTQSNLYDASGLRVRRKSTTTSGTRTTLFPSQYFNLEGEQLSSQGGIKHIFAGGQRIATVLGPYNSTEDPASPATPGLPYFVHGDHLGSTTVVTDELGGVHQSHEYFVDGEAWIDRSPSQPANGFLFNGKPFDPETKFYDYGQRFYDPKTSLWLGVDPAFTEETNKSVGRPLMLSVGAFSGHNPIRNIDPDGRDFFWVQGTGKDLTVSYVQEGGGPGGWAGRFNARVLYGAEGEDLVVSLSLSASFYQQGIKEIEMRSNLELQRTLEALPYMMMAGEAFAVMEYQYLAQTQGTIAEARAMAAAYPAVGNTAIPASRAMVSTASSASRNGARSWKEAGISPSDAKRIQNAANRTQQRITVVGSRANGTAKPDSDWDYVMYGNSRQRHSARSSVPRGVSGGEIGSSGRETGIDVFGAPVTEGRPHCIFDPEITK